MDVLGGILLPDDSSSLLLRSTDEGSNGEALGYTRRRGIAARGCAKARSRGAPVQAVISIVTVAASFDRAWAIQR
jgi:hypothetical protein